MLFVIASSCVASCSDRDVPEFGLLTLTCDGELSTLGWRSDSIVRHPNGMPVHNEEDKAIQFGDTMAREDAVPARSTPDDKYAPGLLLFCGSSFSHCQWHWQFAAASS